MEETRVGIESTDTVGNGTVAVVLSAPDGFEAAPGQFVQLARDVDGEKVVRHYTLSSPYVDGSLEVTVEVDPEGKLSPVLASLGDGDTVSIDGPYGRSYYEGEKKVIVIAGGPGVGPAVGIGERVTDEWSAEGVGVVYRDSKPAHSERLDALREEGATVKIIDGDTPLLEPTERVLEAVGKDARVFVYGFADSIAESKDVLEEIGYAGEPLFENFG